MRTSWHFGRRDAEIAEAHGSQRIEDTAITVIDFAEVRKCGASEVTHRAIEDLCRPEIVGITGSVGLDRRFPNLEERDISLAGKLVVGNDFIVTLNGNNCISGEAVYSARPGRFAVFSFEADPTWREFGYGELAQRARHDPLI